MTIIRENLTSIDAVTLRIEELLDRARAMTAGGRRLLGITGAPGAGKSTVCAALIAELEGRAVLVGMDGFHLANDELVRLGRRDRKGAPDTFDVDGYVALLDRLRTQRDGIVYAPVFDRALEESIGCAVPVSADVPLVITEGNYLTYDRDGWGTVASRLDEVWHLDVEPERRRERLIARRRSYGESTDDAAAWVRDVDEPNAMAVEAARSRAHLIVRVVNATATGSVTDSVTADNSPPSGLAPR